MTCPSAHDISQLLRSWSEGDQTALDTLVPLVYDELHRLAHHYMRHEKRDHVLQTTAVMLYVPVLEAHPGRHDLWLLLGMASTLAGNLTLIGSIANLIVVEIARDDVQISFMRYLRVGVPVTFLSLSAGVLILAL